MSANLQSFCQTKKCFADYFTFSACFFAHLGIKRAVWVCRVYAEWLVCRCRTYCLLSAMGTFVYVAGREAGADARLWRGRGVRVVSDKSDKVHIGTLRTFVTNSDACLSDYHVITVSTIVISRIIPINCLRGGCGQRLERYVRHSQLGLLVQWYTNLIMLQPMVRLL